MATTPSLLPIDAYLRTSYEPDADYVDGDIEERHLGEYEHARIQSLLSALFIRNEKDWRITTVVEQRIRVTPTRVRIADIAVLRADAPRESVTQTPPLICIEVLSPEDRIPRVEKRLADYLAMGIENIWLIDPIRRSAHTYDAQGLHHADSTNLHVPHTPIHLDMTEIFAALD
ncbi:Endonuclease, Uma2 family (restriction endonuclease fold) [Bryocella elongata]|uniref:Endonuclease, Uma2 family (Restriction endonuclease fold) n=1 Tax=Bryocella elongata TaxID=863522 RepID=A0A1H5SYX7_9BACT|nr:Uma2 family endonuclease [Bryocella elongata]SEF55138.1 Endonuclease, Uma2 family (restriction endonuclease fold) [Bryocella elongata]